MKFKSRQLALFPLSTILFPDGRLPLKIFEQRYLDLVKNCLANDTSFGLCGIREGHEVGEPAVPYEAGTEVRILEWDMPQPGIFHIVVEGMERYIARSWAVQENGLLMGEIDSISVEPSCPVPEELRLCSEVLRHALHANNVHAAEAQYHEAVWVGYRLAELMPFKLSIKQDLLVMNDSLARLRILDQFLRQQAK